MNVPCLCGVEQCLDSFNANKQKYQVSINQKFFKLKGHFNVDVKVLLSSHSSISHFLWKRKQPKQKGKKIEIRITNVRHLR